MIRQEIIKLIEKASGASPKEIRIEHPEKKGFGDYSTNIALKLKEPAPEIVKKLESDVFEKVEVAGPGFINFFLSQKYLQQQVGEILKQKESFGQLNIGKNSKVQVEFISANPTGPLTVGNARGGPLGDVLSKVLGQAGFKVEKAYYINDCGRQILTLGHSVLKDKEAQYKGDYIDDIHQKIKEKDPYKAGQSAAKMIVVMIKKTTDKMGIKYDEWFSEDNLYKSGQVEEALKALKKKDLIYEKEGAQWFKSSKYGDERDRVVVKADDSKTYLAGDIAYHQYKFEKKKFARVINIWGADHYGDVPGLQAAVQALGHKGKLDIILLQFVTIMEKGKGLKMSKRRGIYVSMDELLGTAGVDATRFFFLQKSANTHLNFDLSLAKEQTEKNPVYYIQYAHARICSILRKAEGQKAKADYGLLKHPSELNLVKLLIRLPEIVEDITKDYQVQRLPQYAIDLATAFHCFYKDCRVISQDKELTQARLALILASQVVLKNTLSLMGIAAPEHM